MCFLKLSRSIFVRASPAPRRRRREEAGRDEEEEEEEEQEEEEGEGPEGGKHKHLHFPSRRISFSNTEDEGCYSVGDVLGLNKVDGGQRCCSFLYFPLKKK